MQRSITLVVLLSAAFALACGGSGGGGADTSSTDVVADASSDTAILDDVALDLPADGVADVAVEVEPSDLPADVAADAPGEAVEDATGDTAVDVPHELPPLPIQPPLAQPADPLKDTGIESCSIYLQDRCQGGVRQSCKVWDAKAKAFTETPDPMVDRVYRFERWRDLYHKPDGMTSEMNFNAATLPGTPESEWSAPERFASQEGMGDSGIWTGWTIVGDILRYSQTGTEADYQRMEQGVRTLLTMYDVTGVPGYFIRYFFLLLPEGAPNSRDHVFRYEGKMNLTHHDRPIAEAALAQLPAVYRDGVMDAEGKVWKGTPMWHGRPSIDQNTGPMNALPMAYALLRDETLKERIGYHLTCYLNRLQRIEITNLQKNPELLKALMQFFNAGELKLDPNDMDLTKMDRIVAYVQRQINTANEDTLDTSCPAGPQLVPWRTIDATSETFLGELLFLTQDMDTSAGGENQIDHYYFPNLRGGDAVHLLHLAAMAYWFTGEEQYRSFLFDELIGNLNALEVADTTGAFDQPKYCSHFFGDQLTYGSWWVLLGMLGDGELKTRLQQAFHTEMWEKLLKEKGNADFYLMYAGEVPEAIGGEGREQALSYALEQLPTMGGNGWVDGQPVLNDPRRSYKLTPEFVMERVPEGIEAVCPTQKEFELCTTEIVFMDITLPGQNLIDYVPCDDADPWQCKLPDGKCTDKMASAALPVNLRQYTDWLWQRNPYALRKGTGLEGGTQMPGADLSEPYWNARRYGFIEEGAGQVLAWQDTGSCAD